MKKSAEMLIYIALQPILLVPTKGIEPSHPCEWQILSLLRLPIPPHGLYIVNPLIRLNVNP